ncbi:MAG: hypothetical protein AAFV07_12865 [Bacteroidota bacterium]
MIKRILILIFPLALIFQSCDPQPSVTPPEKDVQVEETQALQDMLAELEEIAGSETCIKPADWVYTPYGDKACGGPQGYLAYSINIDTEDFLKKVKAYTEAERDYNRKWGIVSDCALHPAPIGINCEGGKAVLQYR